MISTLHAVCENPTLHEIHRSKISLHRAKVNYSYPTVRLPHTFSVLAGYRPKYFKPCTMERLPFLLWSQARIPMNYKKTQQKAQKSK